MNPYGSQRELGKIRKYKFPCPLRFERLLADLEGFLEANFRGREGLEVGFNTKEEEVHKLVYRLVHLNMSLIMVFVCLVVSMSS